MRWTASGIARDPVAVAVEVIRVVADDLDRSRVLGTVAASTLAVVVGGVRVEAGTFVVGVAFRVGAWVVRERESRSDPQGPPVGTSPRSCVAAYRLAFSNVYAATAAAENVTYPPSSASHTILVEPEQST